MSQELVRMLRPLDLRSGNHNDDCGCVEVKARSWAPSGELHAVGLGGYQYLLGLLSVSDELARRREHGLGSVTDLRTLEVLSSLPVDVPVAAKVLGSEALSVLRPLPSAVVEFDGAKVVRHLAPAVVLESAGVFATTWKQAVARISALASYCTRYVILGGDRGRAQMELATMDARYYGLGLATVAGGELEWLVEPAPFRPERFTASSWLLAEKVFDQLP